MGFLRFPWFEHLSSILISIIVLFYIFRRRSEIIRSTQNVSRVFGLIIGVTLVILLLNGIRMIQEILGSSQSLFSTSLDLFAIYGNLSVRL